MVTFTINIPQTLEYIIHTWILWHIYIYTCSRANQQLLPRASNAGYRWLPCAVRPTDPGVAVGPVTALDQSLAARSERGAAPYLVGPRLELHGLLVRWYPPANMARLENPCQAMDEKTKGISQWENRWPKWRIVRLAMFDYQRVFPLMPWTMPWTYHDWGWLRSHDIPLIPGEIGGVIC